MANQLTGTVNPSLREEGDDGKSNVGATATAKRQKTGGKTVLPTVSNNFGGRGLRGAAKDGLAVDLGARGSAARNREALLAADAAGGTPPKQGMASIGPGHEEKTPKTKEKFGGGNGPEESKASKAGTKKAGGMAPDRKQPPRGGNVPSTSTPIGGKPPKAKGIEEESDPEEDEVEEDDLLHLEDLLDDMRTLQARMDKEGTAAARFAENAGEVTRWVDDYETTVASTKEEGTRALEAALAPEAAHRTYLAIVNESGVFGVFHGLRRWTTGAKGVNEGRIVAFEGEVRADHGAPHVWRFEEEDEDVFDPVPLPDGVSFMAAVEYYGGVAQDSNFWEDVAPATNNEQWTGRLIPIPTQWAPLFLDYPNLGTAFKRALELVARVDQEEQEKFWGFARSMMYACCSNADHKKPTSALSMAWKRLPRTETISAWAANEWNEGANPTVPTEAPPAQETPKADTDEFAYFFGARKRVSRKLKQRTEPSGQRVRPGLTQGGWPAQQPTMNGASMEAIGELIKTMIDAQSEAQVAMMNASNKNLIAFHTETAKAMVAKATGDDSKLTAAKKKILMACAGHADMATFAVPAVYKDVDVEGGTTDALGRILRHRLKPIPLSAHKTNIHVTPQLVATVKALSFSSNGDKTYTGCTKGMTPFATPWRTAEAMNEDIAEDGYFDAATLKSVADIRKHVTGAKVELPTSLLGVVRVLNNYLRLLEVLFGEHCPHLLMVMEIRDGLEDQEFDLESRLTQPLILHLMWRIHHDARQFFAACEGWDTGESLPQSALGLTVRHLVDDCVIHKMMTCPESAFLGKDTDAPPAAKASRSAKTATATTGAGKPSVNTAIPPLCKTAVAKFTKQYPDMGIMALVKKGGIRLSDVQVGGKGECINFGLLGKCPGCRYNHVVCKVADARQVAIAKNMEKAMAAMKTENSAPL